LDQMIVQLIGHLRVANECRAEAATLTAAFERPYSKARPAGGLLLYFEYGPDHN